ncbi:MAG: OmpH family outer membrane protein [Roseobacter sp.]
MSLPSARRSNAMKSIRHFLVGLAVAICLTSTAPAQTPLRTPAASPVLTIDSDRLFEDSNFGRETVEEIEQLGGTLAAENRIIEEELTAEEKKLTDIRATTDPVEFREMADAFDAKVQETRRRQDVKSRDLNTRLENRRVVFLQAAAPVLEQLMRETGAAVVLERRSVFISSNAVDITQIAIDRLNLALAEQNVPAQND